MNTRVVTTLIGAFLIVAAVLKAVSLDETSVTPGRLSDEWRLGLASVGAELFLGVWLAVGVFPATSRRAAAAAFLAFAGVSLSKSIDGQPSYGYLGSVEVDPRLMLYLTRPGVIRPRTSGTPAS